MKRCHEVEMDFTGRTCAAVPGQELVTVGLTPAGKGDDGKDHWLWRNTIQAWGEFRETLIHNYEPSRSCPDCEAEDDPEHSWREMRPMIVDEFGALEDGTKDVKFVGVYAAGQDVDQEVLADVLTRLREERAAEEARKAVARPA